MVTANNVYERVSREVNEGKSVREGCRKVAERLHVDNEVVEVVVAGKNDEWFRLLGFHLGSR